MINDSNQSHSNEQSNRTDDSLQIVKVYIPSLPGAYAFNPNCYNKAKLSRQLNKTEFDDIIFKASRILGDSLLQKNNNDKFEIPKRTILLGIVYLVCLVFFILFCYLSRNHSKAKEIAILVFAFIFAAVALGIIGYQSLSSFFERTREYKSLNDIIKRDLAQFCRDTNLALTNSGRKNVKFNFNSANRSLECLVFVDKAKQRNQHEVDISE